MSNQLNILLLLFGGLQGCLLSVMLIHKKVHRAGYGFLAAYIVVLIVQLLFKVASKLWLMRHLPFYYEMSGRLPLLYGPLVYLFTHAILGDQRRRPLGTALHFAPFIIIAFLVTIGGDRSPGWLHSSFYGPTGLTLQLASLFIYHYLSLRLWTSHSFGLEDQFSETSQLRMKWLRKFIILSFFICVAISLLLFFMYRYFPTLHFLRWGFLSLTLFIYWISYEAMSSPALFSAGADWQEKAVPVMPIAMNLVLHRKPGKYSNTGLRDDEAARIASHLQLLMERDRLYLDPTLTIDRLAELAQTVRHNVSQVLNERIGKSFYDYVNQYRVRAAGQMLLDPSKAALKVAAIAYDSGFNSLSAFNEVFKKHTGLTPSQFRKSGDAASLLQRG